jgi:hypothetical protein
MARMFPDPMPAWVRQNPLRSTECRVYDALREQLSDSWSVFYSRPWLGLTPEGREVDGEADFVLAHPARGLLAIEVKGGAVSRDGRTDTWTSKDRHGIVHNIKNPVKQARDSKYQLLEKLKKHSLWPGRFVRIEYAVLLPDCERPEEDLGPDMPLHIFGFTSDLDSLENWAESRLGTQGDWDVLGKDGIAVVKDLLARSFELRVPLRAELALEANEIRLLTEQQFHILDFAKGLARLVVEGGAGCGKTVLASELAVRMAQDGLRVLLTCFNRPLAEDLKKKLRMFGGVTVRGFHELCLVTAAEAGVDVERIKTLKGDSFDSAAFEAFFDSLDAMKEKFDAVIVDEGQDFESGWLVALELTLRSENEGRLYIFRDNNQKIYARNSDATRAHALAYPLNRNLRNTKRIYELARIYYSGEGYVSAGPEGKTIEWLPRSKEIAGADVVLHVVSRLVAKEMIAAGEIAVISCGGAEQAAALRQSIAGKYQTTDADHRKHGCLIVDSVRRFKGLESKVVVLCDVESIVDNAELLYVAFTRAQLYLVVIGADSAIEALRKPLESIV